MILYFADRRMRILGHASTVLPKGYVVSDDIKAEEVETGITSFSCFISYNDKNRLALEEMTNAGNYLLRSADGDNEFYTIIDTEINTKNKEIYIYAEDAGLDLLNERADAFEADASYTADWYINKYIIDSGFEIGINEIPSSTTRQLKWESEETVTSRLASIATQFGGYEISFTFDIDGLEIVRKKLNIFQKRGKDTGETLRLNKEIDRIITSKSVANLATAFVCEGGVPDKAEEPITLKGYKYDDGNFYVDDNGTLKSRKAVEKWSRYVWNKEPNKLNGYEGHIVRPYSYNTTDQKTLCSHAITELKKYCDIEINYEIDVSRLPDNVKIGDRINIVDDAGELYVSSRVLKLETSIVNQKHAATLGEHLIKTSGISQKVADLAAKFAETSASAARALTISNTAKNNADEAKAQAEAAAGEADAAQAKADEAIIASETATASAAEAQAKALAAQAAVSKVESSVSNIEKTVENANTAAENAYTAAETASAKAEEAKTAAENAVTDAAEAKSAAETAGTKADSAIGKADSAISEAGTAKTTAEAASTIAAAAKLDAEQAEKDVAAFGESLETYKLTMEANYARKTDLTETESKLQSQITANAGELSSTIQQVTKIDETANDAKNKAEAAQSAASSAQSKADQATADATAAQTAANEAAAAAAAAQSEADTAAAAAAAAKSVADKADKDLATAKAALETVQDRVDATEEEIAAAQAAVEAAQSAAATAKADATTAAQKAAEAQTTATTAVTNAATAQTAANEAASQAALAQKTADDAKGDASAAQTKANEAAAAAAEAQSTASTAVSNAAAAQAKANKAATDAASAQQAANAATTKAIQTQTDLNTAKQNLANVTSRVDATEEEVAAAQAAVEAAQSAADTAQAEAEAAQSTADTAKANANAAQSAADIAKTAADNAQKAAEDAQNAADKAQADVGALETRVTIAETSITQNQNAITLRATKTEVTQAISDIKIGGRNLATGTSNEWIDINVPAWSYYLSHTVAGSEGEADFKHNISDYGISQGDYITVAADIKATGKMLRIRVDFYNSANTRSSGANYGNTIEAGSEGRSSLTLQADENYPNLHVYICSDGTVSETTTEQYKCFKVEKGNKATEWSPAPEDIRSYTDAQIKLESDNITSTVTGTYTSKNEHNEALTQIQQLADSISQLVRGESGGTLVKQDEAGLYYFDISNIESNISDTANSLGELEGIVLNDKGEIDVLKSTAAALQNRTEYIRSYTDENNQPCLELGEGDSKFKVRITNTEIQFEDDGAIPARINRQMLIIEKTIIKDELQFGDEEEVSGVWLWKRRNNGNLGLTWKWGGN